MHGHMNVKKEAYTLIWSQEARQQFNKQHQRACYDFRRDSSRVSVLQSPKNVHCFKHHN